MNRILVGKDVNWPDNSRWDGFDRGTLWSDENEYDSIEIVTLEIDDWTYRWVAHLEGYEPPPDGEPERSPRGFGNTREEAIAALMEQIEE